MEKIAKIFRGKSKWPDNDGQIGRGEASGKRE